MRQYEAVDGPYARWLKSARARVGERVWDMLMDMEQSEVEAVFRLKGVVPYEYSAEKFDYEQAVLSSTGEGPGAIKFLNRSADGKDLGVEGPNGVKLVLVHYGPDVIVEVDRDDDPEARAAKFPKFTRDLD